MALAFCGIVVLVMFFFFFQAEDGIRDKLVTGVQTCALPIYFVGDALVVAAHYPWNPEQIDDPPHHEPAQGHPEEDLESPPAHVTVLPAHQDTDQVGGRRGSGPSAKGLVKRRPRRGRKSRQLVPQPRWNS